MKDNDFQKEVDDDFEFKEKIIKIDERKIKLKFVPTFYLYLFPFTYLYFE